jgi:hypothetical protein
MIRGVDDSPYHRCGELTTLRISDAGSQRLRAYGEFFKKYLKEGGIVCIFWEIETKAQTFRYRSLLPEQNQNVLIWSAYYRNKSRTFQSVPKLFKIELERFSVF